MNTAMIAQPAAAAGTTYRGMLESGGQAIPGDAFAALLTELFGEQISQQPDAALNGLPAQISGLIGAGGLTELMQGEGEISLSGEGDYLAYIAMLQRLSRKAQEESNEDAMSMAAELLMIMQPAAVQTQTGEGAAGGAADAVEALASDTASQAADAAQAALQAADAALADAALADAAMADTALADAQAAYSEAAQAAWEQVTEASDTAAATPAGAGEQVNASSASELRADSELPIVSVEKLETETAGAQAEVETNFPVEQMRYSGAIRRAQENLKSLESIEPGEVDIEALEAALAGRGGRTEFVREPAPVPTPEPQEVIRQVSEGIRSNATGSSDFVIKLSPEGLGEITVKMTEQDGRVILSIATTSDDVARMLGRESAMLQNALRPMQAELREITVMPPDTAAYAGMDSSLMGQQFAQNRQSGWQQQSTGSGNYRRPVQADEVAPIAAPTRQAVKDSALDSYI